MSCCLLNILTTSNCSLAGRWAPRFPSPLRTWSTLRKALCSVTSRGRSFFISTPSIRPMSAALFGATRNNTTQGEVRIGPLTNGAGYNRTETMTSQAEQTIRTDSYFNNTLALGAFSLTSGVGRERESQSSPADASFSETDRSLWSERADAQLPLNFSVKAEHNYRKRPPRRSRHRRPPRKRPCSIRPPPTASASPTSSTAALVRRTTRPSNQSKPREATRIPPSKPLASTTPR